MKRFFKKWTIPNTYYGFPMSVETAQSSRKGSRGVALMIAMLTIMMMVGLVTDMIISTSVNVELAIASRDRIRAEYLAKSGFNWGLFFLTMSWGFDLTRAQQNAPAMIQQPLSDNGKSIWAEINKLPPIGNTMVELLKVAKEKKSDDQDDDPFKLRGVMSEEITNTMKIFEDSFSVKIIDEASKINVNECSTGRCEETIAMLTALFSCPAEKAFLESKNIEPEQLAYRIKDFISSATSTSPESGFSDKNTPYQQESNPPYSTKGLPFDSVEELKLVAGWDDDIHTVFAPYLTTFPFPKAAQTNKFSSPININTVKPELLSCLIPDARSSACAESFAQKMFKIKKDNSVVFEKSIPDTLKKYTCYSGSSGTPETTSTGEKIDLTTWFDQKSSVFRLEVYANTGKQDRKLVTVVRRIMPQEKGNGREHQVVKRSFQILHWNLP